MEKMSKLPIKFLAALGLGGAGGYLTRSNQERLKRLLYKPGIGEQVQEKIEKTTGQPLINVFGATTGGIALAVLLHSLMKSRSTGKKLEQQQREKEELLRLAPPPAQSQGLPFDPLAMLLAGKPRMLP